MNDSIIGSGDPIAIVLAQLQTDAERQKAEEPEPADEE